jgi:hypothetical protein
VNVYFYYFHDTTVVHGIESESESEKFIQKNWHSYNAIQNEFGDSYIGHRVDRYKIRATICYNIIIGMKSTLCSHMIRKLNIN